MGVVKGLMILRTFIALSILSVSVHASTCDKPIYLTFDTGNMAVAEHVASVLKKHDVKATFFWRTKKPSGVIIHWMNLGDPIGKP